ncbi:MAG: four helix bundle protein [Candidatus Promineifilaceae bacterium]
MATGDDLEDRLLEFAVRVIKICESLPRKPAATHIRGQLLRSGTSPAPNYAEARSAESQKDFVHKLKVVLKELNESRVWIKMILKAELMPEKRMVLILDETEQLCRIISKSIKTSQRKALEKLT